MNDPFQMQPELRYGAPVCDQILTGRYFTIGYSWRFRQAKWTLEIINRDRDFLTTEDERRDILETYVLTAPVFYFGQLVETIGEAEDDFGIDVPVPHAFIKSVLVENKRGKFRLWTFEMKNEELDGDLGGFLVKTYDAEQLIGGRFWDRVAGGDLHEQKKDVGEMWEIPSS